MPYPKNAAVGSLPLEEIEKEGLNRGDEFAKTGTAYALEQATRPATIGFVLSSSPLALLAWYVWHTVSRYRIVNRMQDGREVSRLDRRYPIA